MLLSIRSTWTVARPASPMTVRKTGFMALNALSALPATVPALARLEADVFSRTNCAAIARPLMSKMDIPFAMLFALQRAAEGSDSPLEEGEA